MNPDTLYERYQELQQFLATNGFISLSFDFRGVGQSEGIFIDGTLDNRLQDAKKAYEELQKYIKKNYKDKKINVLQSQIVFLKKKKR